jgi:hypothetical protein
MLKWGFNGQVTSVETQRNSEAKERFAHKIQCCNSMAKKELHIESNAAISGKERVGHRMKCRIQWQGKRSCKQNPMQLMSGYEAPGLKLHKMDGMHSKCNSVATKEFYCNIKGAGGCYCNLSLTLGKTMRPKLLTSLGRSSLCSRKTNASILFPCTYPKNNLTTPCDEMMIWDCCRSEPLYKEQMCMIAIDCLEKL